MAEKKYIVVTPIKRPGEKKGETVKVEPGKPVTLDEAEAKPLIACGAIREPEVITEDEKPASKK
jgi:hypothetical protein